MNRVIILGNGFDLAHGLKTSYYDFINKTAVDSFLEVEKSQGVSDKGAWRVARTEIGVDWKFKPETAIKDVLHYLQKSGGYSWNTSSQFIKDILEHCDLGWVDIESQYYRHLKVILGFDRDTKEKKVVELNQSLTDLTTLLRDYLTDNCNRYWTDESYVKLFTQPIDGRDIVFGPKIFERPEPPRQTKFLNFNFTNTIDSYIPTLKERKLNCDVINIHGSIKDYERNPLIFGFGDEFDAKYAAIEAEKTKGFLTHIKSFSYFKTNSYHDLVRFIHAGHYQVFIVGHSCGLTDKTMLNMIFEDTNCVSIKVFYHRWDNGDNFTELTENISRHFNNKRDMRLKILPKTKSEAMPQIPNPKIS